MQWVLAAISSEAQAYSHREVDNSTDNLVVPEPVEPAVPEHFINEALMDKTVKPGDDFYMYALGTWFNSHKEGDLGYKEYYDSINTNEAEKSLFASDNPLARHLVRNIEAPAPSLNEDVKAILDYLHIQKPTGIGILLTEIGKLQDKGPNPIFAKKVDIHMQSHSCQEIVSSGIQTQLVGSFAGIKNERLAEIIVHQDHTDDHRQSGRSGSHECGRL